MFKHKINNFLGFVKSLLKPSRQEKEYIFELKNTFRQIKIKNYKKLLPEPEWSVHMNTLREYVLKRDPRRFLRWDVIAGTMCVGNASYIPVELKYLKNCPDWNTRWSLAITESPVGCPDYSPHFPVSSGNLIHHAYHLANFEEIIKTKVNNINYIFEFGGGYGSLCRLLFNLGFYGKYIIYDLPPFSALQRYFLKNIGLPVNSSGTFKKTGSEIICMSDIHELKTLLAEQSDGNISLFIATYSISELPINARDTILPLTADFDTHLIAYQDRFGEVDNCNYFNTWGGQNTAVEWHSIKIKHLPGSNYLFGKNSNFLMP